MATIREIDRSFVTIFDIGGFTKKDPKEQTALIGKFIEKLNEELLKLSSLAPDAFSTGDGAIVSIGRDCKIDEDSTKIFINFVIRFMVEMLQLGLPLRSSVNYSEKDNILMIENFDTIHGKFIQVGDTINLASRVITFAEIGEILFNKAVHDFLRKMGLGDEYNFVENESVTTKHGEVLNTYSYIPRENETTFLYDPTCKEHQYKKYNYFPPVSGEIIRFFMLTGLDFELKKIIDSAFQTVSDINYTRQLMSYSNVFNVLTQLNYDPEDTVYVLNRQDRGATFWTQPMKRMYIRYLEAHAKKNDGVLNQIRVRVYDSEKADELFPDEDIYWDIVNLHRTNSYYSVPSNLLIKFDKLNELLFGVTVSKKYKYAVIPIPSPEAFGVTAVPLDTIGNTLFQLRDYETSHGPMKAIISANERYIIELINEFEQIIKDPLVTKEK